MHDIFLFGSRWAPCLVWHATPHLASFPCMDVLGVKVMTVPPYGQVRFHPPRLDRVQLTRPIRRGKWARPTRGSASIGTPRLSDRRAWLSKIRELLIGRSLITRHRGQ